MTDFLRSIMADETKTPVAEHTASEAPAAPAPSAPSHAPHRSGPRDSRDSRGPRPGGPGGGREGGRKFFRRKKVCKFCVEKIESINYKDVRLLAGFVAESGKIVPRRLTGVCTPHQRRLSTAIKQARNIALLPFAGRSN
jgi:small subunit ribosomal protein S18